LKNNLLDVDVLEGKNRNVGVPNFVPELGDFQPL
jgi:hypothetical protein